MELVVPGPTARPRIDAALTARAVQLGGLAVVVLGSFGPWLRSGDRVRTSYELFQVADRLGFLGDGALRWLPRAWVCVPLLAATALALHVRGHHRAGSVTSSIVAAAAIVVAGRVLASPLPSEWGSVAGVLGGVSCLIATVTPAVVTVRNRMFLGGEPLGEPTPCDVPLFRLRSLRSRRNETWTQRAARPIRSSPYHPSPEE